MPAGVLRVRAFAKINLALAVLGRRPDGFHEIRTVYQSLDIHDELELTEAEAIELEAPDLPEVPVEQNIVWKAAKALSQLLAPERGARILLRKNVPAGAGLGGGSSNAAAALLGLCRLWNLRPPDEALRSLAARLGSDVPFFLTGGTALGSGRGEIVEPLPDIGSSDVVVVYPGVHVSTSDAYESLGLQLTSAQSEPRIQSFCSRLVEGTKRPAGIFNDFETAILPAYPVIREAKSLLAGRGATATLLSGSGSSVFGFFLDEESALAASRALSRESWRVFPAKTLSRAEYLQRMLG